MARALIGRTGACTGLRTLILSVALQGVWLRHAHAQVLDTGAGKSPPSEPEEELVWGPQKPAKPPAGPPAAGEAPATTEPTKAEAEESEPYDSSNVLRTANRVQASVGYRFGMFFSNGKAEVWSWGFGVAGGYTFDFGLYAGVSCDLSYGPTGAIDQGVILQLAAEIGYDLRVDKNSVLRPKVGFGGFHYDNQYGGELTGTVLAPGISYVYRKRQLSFMIDIRYDVVFADKSLQGVWLGWGFGI